MDFCSLFDDETREFEPVCLEYLVVILVVQQGSGWFQTYPQTLPGQMRNWPCYSGCWRSRGKDSCQHRSWLYNLWARGSISSWGHVWSRCRASAGNSPGLSCWDTTQHTHKYLQASSLLTGQAEDKGSVLRTQPSGGDDRASAAFAPAAWAKHCMHVGLQSKHRLNFVLFSRLKSELWGRRRKKWGEDEGKKNPKSPHLNFIILKIQILERRHTHTHTHPESAYREQVEESVTAALFLRFFVVGLSTLSLGSRVRMRCGILVLKSAWPLTFPAFRICRILSSSTPAGSTAAVPTLMVISILANWPFVPAALTFFSSFFYYKQPNSASVFSLWGKPSKLSPRCSTVASV